MPWIDDVTLEVSFGFGSGPLATSPTWTDIVADVRRVETFRGRASTQRPFDAGTARVTLDNTAGEYDPNNTGATHTGNLNLGTPVRIRAVHNLTTYDVFRGYVSRWPLRFEQPNESTVDIELTETYAIARRAHLEAQAYSQEAPDTRIGNILDDVGWPAGWRTLDTPVTDLVAAITYSGRAGSLLDDTIEAEQGQLFQARDGDLTFYNRVQYTSAAAVATFGAGGVDYSDPQFRYDDDLLVNEAAVTGADDDTQAATDATSVTTYGPSADGVSTISNDSILSAPYALNIAEWLVEQYKDAPANVRIAEFTIYPAKDEANLFPQALGRELGDVVNVEYTPPAGDAFDQDVRLESITHDIRPASWVTRFGCDTISTIEQNTFWILGTSQLDVDTRLA